MKPTGRASLPPRKRSRGIAVLELALSLVFLIPLLMGMLDFGYYFYVSSNVEEAARAGVRQAALTPAPNCAAGAGTIAAVQAPAVGTGRLCGGGAAACYLNQAPLMLGTAPNTTVNVLLQCWTPITNPLAPSNPTWQITLTVDFPLAYGFFRPMFKPGAVSGTVRYVTTVTTTP